MRPPTRRLGKIARREKPPARRALVTFQLDDRVLALPTERVARVAELEGVAVVPAAAPWNLGLVRYRGAVVSLVDLRRLVGGERSRPPTGRFFCVFGRFRGGVAGFAVDRLLGLRTVLGGEPTPDLEVLDLDEISELR